MEWPPSHRIRRSRRARRISLTITASKNIEIVLPIRATIKEGLQFLDSKRSWVEKHLLLVVQKRQEETCFPTEIYLTSINKKWLIRYHHINSSKKIALTDINERLTFTGNIQEFKSCLPVFNRWLRVLAKVHLSRWLSQVSQEIQLPYNRLSIRSQKTLWGSCNRQKNISLNDRLLFLPYEMVRYVLIHELCHTVYFEHSQHFWRLVAGYDSNYAVNEKNLRDVSFYLPSYFCDENESL